MSQVPLKLGPAQGPALFLVGKAFVPALQGYLPHKHTHPPRTLPPRFEEGPTGVGVFLWARYPCKLFEMPVPGIVMWSSGSIISRKWQECHTRPQEKNICLFQAVRRPRLAGA